MTIGTENEQIERTTESIEGNQEATPEIQEPQCIDTPETASTTETISTEESSIPSSPQDTPYMATQSPILVSTPDLEPEEVVTPLTSQEIANELWDAVQSHRDQWDVIDKDITELSSKINKLKTKQIPLTDTRKFIEERIEEKERIYQRYCDANGLKSRLYSPGYSKPPVSKKDETEPELPFEQNPNEYAEEQLNIKAAKILDAVTNDGCDAEYDIPSNRAWFKMDNIPGEEGALQFSLDEFKKVKQQLKDAGYEPLDEEEVAPKPDDTGFKIFVKIDPEKD